MGPLQVSWRLESDLIPVGQELRSGEKTRVRPRNETYVRDLQCHGLIEVILDEYFEGAHALASLYNSIDAGDGVATWSEVC